MATGVKNFASKFGPVDYTVFGLVLAISAGIGIFYGFFGSKQKTAHEYLLGQRQMSYFPVAMSLFCSYVSAISVLGFVPEVYFYGTIYEVRLLGFIPLTLGLAYLYVPVYFNLRLSSANEYLELRFSRGTRVIVSLMGVVYSVIYMSLVVYGPSLAIQQVTGISTRLSTAAIFLVCIFYSAIGGLKAVLWTDVFQTFIMLGSLAVVAFKGMTDVGGFSEAWQKTEESNRVNFFIFDPDPRTRHTFWTSIIAAYFSFMVTNASTQAQVQRYMSLPSLTNCRKALLLAGLGHGAFTILCFICAIAICAKYWDCDPIQNHVVTSSDQLLPLFVMETVGNLPGLPGLFVAGLTSASLSTVSSSLSSLASTLTYDYVKTYRPSYDEERLSLVSKFATAIFGLFSFGIVFVAERVESILPAAMSLIGIILGPTFGIFTLGMFFPVANKKGSVLGLLTTFAIMAAFVTGVYVANDKKLLPNQKLPLSTKGCAVGENSTIISTNFNHTTSQNFMTTKVHTKNFETLIGSWKDEDDNFLIQILSISFNWHPGMGSILTILLGLIFSLIFSPKKSSGVINDHCKVHENLLSPPILSLWRKLWPNHVSTWVTPTTTNDEQDKNFTLNLNTVSPVHEDLVKVS